MATINEQIVTGRKFRKLVDETTKLWQRISFWTKASDVEFNDGKTAEEKIGNLNDITNSLQSKITQLTNSENNLQSKITQLTNSENNLQSQITQLTNTINNLGTQATMSLSGTTLYINF